MRQESDRARRDCRRLCGREGEFNLWRQRSSGVQCKMWVAAVDRGLIILNYLAEIIWPKQGQARRLAQDLATIKNS